MSQMSKRVGSVLLIGGLGLMLGMCAPSTANVVGDAMVEVGSRLRDASSDAASAQLTCTDDNWQVTVVNVGGALPYDTMGWEPFAAGNGAVWLRRCTP